MTQPRPIVVLTALNLEYQAVKQHLANCKLQRHESGTQFEIGQLPDSKRQIVIAVTGPGNHTAGIMAEQAFREFRPAAMFFVGVAGALWDSPGLGDVVVASRVYAYHGGTSDDDGLKARPRAWEVPHRISQLANSLVRDGEWANRLPSGSAKPHVRLAPIAAGEIVQNSRTSREAQWIRQTYNDAVAIEMEGAGLAHAGHLNSADVAIIRGISDMADGAKNSTNDRNWQPIAAANAAAFAIQLAEVYTDHGGQSQMSAHSPDPMNNANAGNTVYNYASGQVGIQAANVSGSNVWMNTAPPDPQTAEIVRAVTELQQYLDNDHASGDIDTDTYEAALDEIEVAKKSLNEPDQKGRKKSILALKRLSGLVTDTASVTAPIALVIATISGLS